MTDQTLEDKLAAAIIGVIGDKSKNGLSPQGEAAVRLALYVGRLRKQLAKRQNNVWHSTGAQVEDGHWEDDCPGETCPVVAMLTERTHDPEPKSDEFEVEF